MQHISDSDPEVRKVPAVYAIHTDPSPISDRIIQRRSSWLDLKKDTALLLRVRCYLKERCASRPLPNKKEPLAIAELAQAVTQIVRFIQRQIFPRGVGTGGSV